MPELLRIIGLGLMATIVIVVLREQRAEWALLIRLGVGVALFLLLVPDLAKLLSSLIKLSELAQISGTYVALLLKVIGIAYLTMFVAHIAYDANEVGTGWRIELAGKVVILLLAVPLIASIAETILKFIPS
ncbi:stage III sporulation protein AD [Sulfobacillus acidophilus TPY]|uniref:Stage III sporulation protein AD n=1 Tax=Sulfobacillus acidophilus (strain ATCC 700253 / DSM 10332 / NAL) TaxID=679936 RepID=G8TYE2_SULAD|nr:stage III sporulation protein AD [Sulfobacillus acidophilus TPY]AEW05106.1 stage III sporulation protein AD [Sulfobacillus acidophilus DSM 10332]